MAEPSAAPYVFAGAAKTKVSRVVEPVEKPLKSSKISFFLRPYAVNFVKEGGEMARYKDYCYEQTKLIPISFHHQILPGTFEYTLNYLIDNEVDLSLFEQRYRNDETGAPAYDPAVLLKIILYAYSRGITSSRQIEQCCGQNIIFMATGSDP